MQRDAGRQRCAGFSQPALEALSRLQRIALFRTADDQLDDRMVAHAQGHTLLFRVTFDMSDGTQFDPAAIIADYRQAGEALFASALIQHPQFPRIFLLAETAGGQVHAEGVDAPADLIQTHLQLLQRIAGDLDRNLFLGQAIDVDLIDAPVQQLLLERAGEMAQFADIIGATQQQSGDRFVADDIENLRLFGILRQIAEFVHPLFGLVERDHRIGSFLELERDRGDALRRGRGDMAQVVDRFQRLFERNGDAGFHVFGAGAAPNDADPDEIELEIREKLNVQALQGKDAADDH